MTRLLGVVLLMVGGGWLGYSHTLQLGRRIWAVAQLQEGLHQMEREITLHLTPLPTLLQDEKLPFHEVFFHCGMGIQRGESVVLCWSILLDELPHIQWPEREILAPLGKILGQFEGDVQGEALRHTAQMLQRQEGHLREEKARLGKVYPVVGLTVGAFLGIFLL